MWGEGAPNSDRPPLSAPLPLYIGLWMIKGVIPKIVVFQAVQWHVTIFPQFDFF